MRTITWSANGMSSSPLDASKGLAGAPGKSALPYDRDRPSMMQDRKSFVAWLQAAPMMLVFALFFPLAIAFL